MSILVTGSAGFIGFHLSKKLLEDCIEVIGYDSVNNYYDPTLKEARLKILKELFKFCFYVICLALRKFSYLGNCGRVVWMF